MRKKNKKSVLQTAPPLWRNLIYINILHNCDVRLRSHRQAEQPHSRLPTVAQRVLTCISTTNLPKFWGYFAKCQPGVLLQAVATLLKMTQVCIISPKTRSIGKFGRQKWSWHGPSGVDQRRARNSAATTSSRNVSSPLQACKIHSAWSSRGC